MTDEAAPTGETPPLAETEPLAETAQAIAAPTARRSRLPWVLLAIGGAVLLVLGVVVAVFVIPNFVGGSPDPVTTVENFDRAYQEVNCELFQASTTEAYRSSAQGSDDAGTFDCARWERAAAAYTVDGIYEYELDVLDAEVATETAVVFTEEFDHLTAEQFLFEYTLIPDVDGNWVIDSIVETEE